MELNEIEMSMDVKLDIYDKRPDSLKFKTWTRCDVKIEAIKCFPCFLRITIQQTSSSLVQDQQSSAASSSSSTSASSSSSSLSVSINVPGVTMSLATSRTKQFSYGLFWTHNRRDCFIYFAADTESNCRKHMKWIKKSIKNLEVYRQVFFEQRRSSRGGPTQLLDAGKKTNKKVELSAVKDALSALGPLPQIPVSNNSFNWSGGRVSRASDIYEEIFEGNVPPRLSRRLSRASIASGIYEEMKPCSQSVINAIVEEHLDCPPPLPPLPPHRKRINTYEVDASGSPGDIPRSNTNPESDLAKKKKYKNVLDNIFGSGRSKRAESVSESQACTMEDIINGSDSPDDFGNPVYVNEILKHPEITAMSNKRNSFSSPDLSKINFLDTFDEEKIAAFLLLQNSSDDLDEHDLLDIVEMEGHNYSSLSLDDSSIGHSTTSRALVMKRLQALKSKSGSVESLNISEQLPQNFNFSACNSSSINLVGASGAVPSLQKLKRNKIVIEDDLTGYCIMAPIQNKKTELGDVATATATSSTTSSTSSGYSTGSYCSTTSSSSSNTNSSERNKDTNHKHPKKQSQTKKSEPEEECDYDQVPLRRTPIPVNDNSSNIYENMQVGSPINASIIPKPHDQTPPINKDFSGNLYENLLTIKAAQELEQPLPGGLCTSTPTESAAEKDSVPGLVEEQENYYQTPRKSIISVDDKVPSYYPNSCDTMKMKRGSISPSKQQTTPTITKSDEKEKSSNNLGLKHLVSIKMKRERKENLYISSPQKILDQRKKSSPTSGNASPNSTSTIPRRSQNAQKISENVYTVNLNKRKSLMLTSHNNNNNNNTEKSSYNDINDAAHLKEKLQTELLQLALLQNIDFKFDDTAETKNGCSDTDAMNKTPTLSTPKQSGISRLEEAELEYENCYRASKDATRLLHKYATLAPKQSMRIKQQLQQHLKNSQSTNQKDLMTQSSKLDSSPVGMVVGSDISSAAAAQVMGSKKFASLPRFKKIDFSPLKLKINNVLQRNQQPDF